MPIACGATFYDVGWGYDSNVAALLGLTHEAAEIVKSRMANSNAAYRWPATWGPNFDWLPDQCHGGNLMATINYMLLQSCRRQDPALPGLAEGLGREFQAACAQADHRRGHAERRHNHRLESHAGVPA